MNVKELIRTINHTLKSHNLFPENSRILVACSGGPDSMALLYLLQDIATHRHTTYKIGVAIVDHCIRPESKEEVLWLQHQVEELGLPFYSATFDVPRLSKEHKKSEETIGRQVRYQWLNEIAQSEGYDYISVAQVQSEYAIPVVRPLLDVTKENLLAYIGTKHISYCVDSTNEDVRYQRNRIRHRIIPELEAVNPAVVDAIVRLGSSVNEDVMVISDLTSRTFDKLVSIGDDEVRISRRALRQEPLAIQRRLWQRLVSTIDSDLTLTSAHQEQLLDIVNTGEKKTFTIKSIKVIAQCDTIKVYCKH